MKYKDWLILWLNNVIKPSVKSRTFARYKEIIGGHIVPELGEYELFDLTPFVLQKFVAELLQCGNLVTGKGLSVNTVNTIVTVVRNSLKSAADWGELSENSADKIRRPKKTEKEIGCFSVAEQKNIEREIFKRNKDKFFGILLCLYTGLRIGELLALIWKDVDFASGVISVTKSCHYGIGENGKFGRCTELPKTFKSRRVIPIPKQILPFMRAVKSRSASEYVIANGNKPVSVRSFQRSFTLLLQRLNIPHRGFHALRHTFATMALECGMDVKTLSEILGHKSASVTLNRYAHSFLGHKREMMNKVGKLLQ